MPAEWDGTMLGRAFVLATAIVIEGLHREDE
jgi:hypothetical protein